MRAVTVATVAGALVHGYGAGQDVGLLISDACLVICRSNNAELEDTTMKFLYQIIGGWHHGRGSKHTRKENYQMALKHFHAALEYALRANNEPSIPLEMECLARTFARLKDYEQAQNYATESLNRYKKLQSASRIFEVSAQRVTALIKAIERRESI